MTAAPKQPPTVIATTAILPTQVQRLKLRYPHQSHKMAPMVNGDASKVLRDFLREAIRKHVFVTKDTHTIVHSVDGDGQDSNWLFDFRAILLEARHLDAVATLFWEIYKDHPRFQVGGIETASIPMIAAIVMKSVERGTPVNGFFIRKSRKKSGLLNMVEGRVTDQPIILVDDLINSGYSFTRQLAVTDELGHKVTDLFAILRFRDEDYYQFAKEKGIRITTIFSLPDFGIPHLIDKKTAAPHVPFRVVWRFRSDNPGLFYVVPKSAPVLDEGRVYFGSDNGFFWALNQEDGSIAWKYRVGFHPKRKAIFSTPAIHDGCVYFGSYDGNVYALDANTGKRKWIFMEADWVGSSPALAIKEELLFIGLEFGLWGKRGGIAALSLRTGEKKWEYRMPGLTHGSPAYSAAHNLVAIGSNDKTAYVFEARTGKLRWKYSTEGEIKGAPAFDDKRGLVLFASFDGGLYIFDAPTGNLLHRFGAEYGFYSNPLLHGDHVYIASFDKKLYAINLDTFQKSWEFTTRGRIFATPVMVDGHIFIGSNDARLYEIDSKTGKEMSAFQVTERITNRIAHNSKTNRFFLPTFANELYCLERNLDNAANNNN
jgi:outer membrane protein assembly factor BamB/orotate phosphoribosyltransferase